MSNAVIPEKTATIEEFLQSNKGSDQISFYNTSIINRFKIGDNDIHLTDSNILDDYMEDLEDISVVVSIAEPELYSRYKYNPHLLAYDVYGSVEFDFIILKLNHIASANEFVFKNVRIVEKNELLDLLNDIFNIERDYIELNRTTQNITMM